LWNYTPVAKETLGEEAVAFVKIEGLRVIKKERTVALDLAPKAEGICYDYIYRCIHFYIRHHFREVRAVTYCMLVQASGSRK
jgi:hypothetical protein